MPNEIYNVGRSAGLSAWEVYIRQSLLLNPDVEPLSEREWLSETIGLGSSMLLKITKDNADGVHSRDFQLPANSLIGAPRTVIGSFFYGEGATDGDSYWCKKVTDYGPGIANNSNNSPSEGSHAANALPSNISDVSDITRKRMMQYIKIQDAIILQDGVWKNSGTSEPAKDFLPDITKPPLVRITFRGRVTEDFYLLLTGFVNRAIIKGEVGFDMGSVIPDNSEDATAFRPENGDYLGPTLYPWANKVIFTYPEVLTSLIRSGLQTDGTENLEIDNDPDTTDTFFRLSHIIAGLGVQVNDPSTKDKPAQDITISSRVQSSNNYLKVADQKAINTKDNSSQVPTTLQSSPAQPAPGVGITQPANPGDPHVIGAKIEVTSDKTGKNANYLGVVQSAPGDADQTATKITPSYGNAGPGIGISDPASPGSYFTVSSKMESSGEGSDYIGIKQTAGNNANDVTTTITPSKAASGRGVGISQPSTPGGKHVISSIVSTEGCGSKYLGVTQPDNENRTAGDISTTFTPSKISSKKGIAITQPSTPGGDITISSIIESKGAAANYLKVEQEAHDSGCGCGCGDGKGADTTSTTITPSRIVAASDESRIVVDQPVTPGGDIKIGTKINFTPHKGISIQDDKVNGVVHIGSVITISGEGAGGMRVSQSSITGNVDNASTELYPSKLVVHKDNQAGVDSNGNPVGDVLKIEYSSSAGGPITWYIDVDEIIRRMLKSGPLHNLIENLLKKIYTGDQATIDYDTGDITWATGDNIKIPMGNLNIYSNDGEGDVFDNAIRSRDGNQSNDLRMK